MRKLEKTFEITSGRLVASDPCYACREGDTRGVRCNIPAQTGTWIAEATCFDNIETNGWGDRVARLEVVSSEWNKLEDSYEEVEMFVDSGQWGVFDSDLYPQGEDTGEYDDPDSFYHKVCHAGDPERSFKFEVIEGLGVVVGSGYGDGGYNCTLTLNEGKVVKIEIVFIDEYHEEDDYYEEEEEEGNFNW